MAVLTIADIDAGTKIAFRSKNANDTVAWKGTLIGKGNYLLIRPYGDPSAYNSAVRQTDSAVSSDVTTLTYFLIEVDNGADVPTIQLFAQEWILSGSLAVINAANVVTLQITDPNQNTQAIVSLLASQGYYSKVVS